jgi:hypothetical protein
MNNIELEDRLAKLEKCCNEYKSQFNELREQLMSSRPHDRSEKAEGIVQHELAKSAMVNRQIVLKPVPEYKTGGPERDSDPRMSFFKDQSESYQNRHDSMDYLNLNEHNRYYYRRTRDEYLKPLDSLEPLGKFKKLVVPANQHGYRPVLPYYVYTIHFAKKKIKCDDGDELYYTDEPPLDESIPLNIHDVQIQSDTKGPSEEKSRELVPSVKKSAVVNRQLQLNPVPEYKAGNIHSDPRMMFFIDQSTLYPPLGYALDTNYVNVHENNRYYFRKVGEKLEPLGKFRKMAIPYDPHRGTVYGKPYTQYIIFFFKKNIKSDDEDELYYTDEPPIDESVPLTIHDIPIARDESKSGVSLPPLSSRRSGLGGRKKKSRKNKVLHKR